MNLYKKGLELLESLMQGSELLHKFTSMTLGPDGRCVLIGQDNQTPIITKDGITVAKQIKSDNPFSQMAIETIRQSAEETNKKSGDGTTTTTIMAHHMLNQAVHAIKQGANVRQLQDGLKKGAKDVIEKLTSMSKPIKTYQDIENVARISSNNDDMLAKIIAEAVDKVGRDGSITIEMLDNSNLESKLEIVEGFSFDSGIINSVFVNDEQREVCKFDNPFILVTDHKISDLDALLPLLEMVARSGRPLVIVADDFGGEALAALILNAAKGHMKIAAIKAPRYGNERKKILEDLAIASGAKFVSRELDDNLEQVELVELGTCRSIESSKYKTTIVDPNPDIELLEKRLLGLKSEIKEANIHDSRVLQERLTRLISMVAIIKIGGATEAERGEKRDRAVDSLEAVLSALDDGFLPGGGMSLYEIWKQWEPSKDNSDFSIGQRIIYDCLCFPLKTLCVNSDISFEHLKEMLKNSQSGQGFDFKNKEMCELEKVGIVDPTRVVVSAIKNSVSSVTTIMNVGGAIYQTEGK